MGKEGNGGDVRVTNVADRLAKAFDRNLAVAVAHDKPTKRRLFDRGWKDFVNTDRPDTNCAAEMAAKAVLYLGVQHDHWTNEPSLISAALAFLREHYQAAPAVRLEDLAALLKNGKVDAQQILGWFAAAYPDSNWR